MGNRPLRSYTRSARSVSPEKPSTERTPPSSSIRFTPQPPSQPPPEPPVPPVMSPRVYRSSYMANKKGTYGESLTTGRRLGRHLPRIASGDANDDWVADEPEKPLPSPTVPERVDPHQSGSCLLKSGSHIYHLLHRSGRHLLKSGSLIYHPLHRSGHLSISDPLHPRSMRFPIWMKSDKNAKKLAREGGRAFGEGRALFRQFPHLLRNKI
jgi:hypothetical protein